MFSKIKKWFGKKQDLGMGNHHQVLTLSAVATNAIRAEVPVFRGPKSISEEVISRVAKEIELEGLGAPRSARPENLDEKGLNQS